MDDDTMMTTDDEMTDDRRRRVDDNVHVITTSNVFTYFLTNCINF